MRVRNVVAVGGRRRIVRVRQRYRCRRDEEERACVNVVVDVDGEGVRASTLLLTEKEEERACVSTLLLKRRSERVRQRCC